VKYYESAEVDWTDEIDEGEWNMRKSEIESRRDQKSRRVASGEIKISRTSSY
jgi:hypothetical protein